MSIVVDIFFIVIILFLLFIVYEQLSTQNMFLSNFRQNLEGALHLNQTSFPFTSNQTGNATSLIVVVPKLNQSQLASYALGLINKDREQYGFKPVTLSSEPSAQQHAESMLENNYFSHWDIYDMKPYMRYTLSGGNESVTENIAYESKKECTLVSCVGAINPNQSLQAMEYSMMYNDSVCCNNGHRDNILNPNHNQVSIGVAYNSSTIYFVEDFIDNYITWNQNTPEYASNGEVYLNGDLAQGYTLSQVYVSYDPPIENMSGDQLPQGSYGYGQNIAGVVNNPLYYYQGIDTINADTYSISGSDFNIAFSIKDLIRKYGAGEYTILLYLNQTQTGSSFIGSDYTIFINSAGQQYIPQYI